jgi:hypothetical protein
MRARAWPLSSISPVVCSVLGLLQLLLEEESALGGFRDGEMLRQDTKLVDIAVGKVRGAARVAILDRDMDQAILSAAVHGRTILEFLARIGEIFLVVLLHQAEFLHHGVLDGAALQHADELVVGTLEAKTAAGQRGHASHGAKLRGQRGAH